MSDSEGDGIFITQNTFKPDSSFDSDIDRAANFLLEIGDYTLDEFDPTGDALQAQEQEMKSLDQTMQEGAGDIGLLAAVQDVPPHFSDISDAEEVQVPVQRSRFAEPVSDDVVQQNARKRLVFVIVFCFILFCV